MNNKMDIRVFLADDYDIVRDSLRSILERQGNITVVGEASNGRQAVREVKKLRPDIVIMDIAMPEMNGIEATSQISKTCPPTQVIMLTVYDSPEYIHESLRAGAKGYILKESAGDELVDAIYRVNSGHNYLSEEILLDYGELEINEQKNGYKSLFSR